MPLSRQKLAEALYVTFSRATSMRAAVAEVWFQYAWASAYLTYAADAVDVSGDPLASYNESAFRRAIRPYSCRSAQQFALQLDAAFIGFWTGATFQVGTPPTPSAPCPSIGGTGIFSVEHTSIVTAVTPSAMHNAVLPVLVAPSASARQRAEELAAAMDAVTKSAVIVTISGLDTTPAPSGPLPIINTCTIF